MDYNGSAQDQVFFRFSYVDDPQYIPGIFGGIADGGSFEQGDQSAHSNQSAGAWTHVFNPNTVNVFRVGFNHLHTSRFGPDGTVEGIPGQFGINGIPQQTENGGLGSYDIGGLSTLGSNAFLPSDEISQTLQLTDDFTKIWGNIASRWASKTRTSSLDTATSVFARQLRFQRPVLRCREKNSGNWISRNLLLSPAAATVANGVDYSGGSDAINASNINKTYDARPTSGNLLPGRLEGKPETDIQSGLALGLLWPDQRDQWRSGQLRTQSQPDNGVPTFLIPASGKDDRSLTTSFTTLLAKDGIALDMTNKYGQGLVQTQKTNFAPRVGFAYQIDPRLVARGGFGFFYNSFENQGYGPNIGENYPFVFNFGYTPIVPAGSPTGLSNVFPNQLQHPVGGLFHCWSG